MRSRTSSSVTPSCQGRWLNVVSTVMFKIAEDDEQTCTGWKRPVWGAAEVFQLHKAVTPRPCQLCVSRLACLQASCFLLCPHLGNGADLTSANGEIRRACGAER